MNDFVLAWMAALRSGKYKQAKLYLRKVDGYCCLGVACELFRQTYGVGEWKESEFAGRYDFAVNGQIANSALPDAVRIALGLADTSGHYAGSRLIFDNDNGMTFDQIADIIESEPWGLFVVRGEGGLT